MSDTFEGLHVVWNDAARECVRLQTLVDEQQATIESLTDSLVVEICKGDELRTRIAELEAMREIEVIDTLDRAVLGCDALEEA
jgi:hypothetical protein